MNQNILALLFFITIMLTACGQYGDLYAPPENPPENSAESSSENLPENLQEQPTEAQEDQTEQDK